MPVLFNKKRNLAAVNEKLYNRPPYPPAPPTSKQYFYHLEKKGSSVYPASPQKSAFLGKRKKDKTMFLALFAIKITFRSHNLPLLITLCLKAPAGANVFGVRDELVWPYPSLDSGSGGMEMINVAAFTLLLLNRLYGK